MTGFLFWNCLSPECQERLKAAGWEPPSEKPVMESLKEIKILMSEAPKNVKRDGRW